LLLLVGEKASKPDAMRNHGVWWFARMASFGSEVLLEFYTVSRVNLLESVKSRPHDGGTRS